MNKLVILSILLFLLAGCATTTPSIYGTFITNSDREVETMATDAVKQITELYPPAITKIYVEQETSDAFGMALINGLRKKGFALSEEYKDNTQASAGQPVFKVDSGIPLYYILDQAGDSLYRLTILVGTQSISRPYLAQNGTVVPAGYWMHKE
jgi:type IV secretion system protein TrbH